MKFFNADGVPNSRVIYAPAEEINLAAKHMIISMLVREASVTEVRAAVQYLISLIQGNFAEQILADSARKAKERIKENNDLN